MRAARLERGAAPTTLDYLLAESHATTFEGTMVSRVGLLQEPIGKSSKPSLLRVARDTDVVDIDQSIAAAAAWRLGGVPAAQVGIRLAPKSAGRRLGTISIASEGIRRMFKELEPVVLLHDIPEASLTAGDVGAVVFVYEAAGPYEVEFVRADGTTIAVLRLGANDLRAFSGNEILHTRRLAS